MASRRPGAGEGAWTTRGEGQSSTTLVPQSREIRTQADAAQEPDSGPESSDTRLPEGFRGRSGNGGHPHPPPSQTQPRISAEQLPPVTDITRAHWTPHSLTRWVTGGHLCPAKSQPFGPSPGAPLHPVSLANAAWACSAPASHGALLPTGGSPLPLPWLRPPER